MASDLATLARSLTRVHDAVLSGATPPQPPRAIVARSWTRVLELGVDPDGRNARDAITPGALEGRRRRSRLSLVVDDLRRLLGSAAEASHYLVVITDADGIVLWREGSARVRRQADRLGFTEGARWTEGAVGTNAIGTALAEATPVQLFSAEHFEAAQHPWYCTAAPIHDPMDGSLIGMVDVSGPAMTLHPTIRALVMAAVQLAEAQLRHHHEQRLAQLRRSVEPILSSSDGPLLVVDEHGWVAAHQGVAGRDRIEAPRPDRAVAVPGIGLCLPEPLGNGWLIRPTSSEVTIRAVLDLTGRPATLEVRSGTAPWQTTLSPRHADLLTAIVDAGLEGVGAAHLSHLLYGDSDHQVTVRAEISRLRRTLGALVAANPYRLADGVVLEVVRPAGG